jgi:4'-phosphopantetheinyl transferase
VRLGSGVIAVWTATLDGEGSPDWLTPEERARADSALDPQERRRRVCARSVLRHVLGAYVGAPPGALQFVTDAHGKPRLANGPQFNLSHSGEVMMLAVCAVGPVGLDVDRCGRLDADWDAVTARTFSEGERAQLLRMPEAERPCAALRGWVRKEAYAKARGAGFAYGFTAFTVRLDAGMDGALLAADDKDARAVAAWSLRDLVAPSGFAASLAHESVAPTLDYRAYENLAAIGG